MGKANFAVIDLETTGLSRTNDEIIEIAIILVDQSTLQITDRFHTLVKPKSARNGASHINRIKPNMLQNAPTFEEIAPTIMRLFSGRKLVGHNITGFDLAFLNNALVDFDYEIPKSACVDTMLLSKKFLPLENNKLITVASFMEVNLSNAHAALFDTQATAEILIKFMTTSEVRAHTYRFSPKACPESNTNLDFSTWESRESGALLTLQTTIFEEYEIEEEEDEYGYEPEEEEDEEDYLENEYEYGYIEVEKEKQPFIMASLVRIEPEVPSPPIPVLMQSTTQVKAIYEEAHSYEEVYVIERKYMKKSFKISLILLILFIWAPLFAFVFFFISMFIGSTFTLSKMNEYMKLSKGKLNMAKYQKQRSAIIKSKQNNKMS